MALDPEELDAAVRDDDHIRVRDLLAGATEADRRAAAKALAGLFKGPRPQSWPGHGEGSTPEQRAYVSWWKITRRTAFIAAAVGVAGGVGVAFKALDGFYGLGVDDAYDTVAAVLADRNPPWLGVLVDRRLAQDRRAFVDWQLARRLVRLGAIDPPGIPEYTTLMIDGLCYGTGQDGSVLAALRADPSLLDDEVWRLFTVPGAGARLRWHTHGIYPREMAGRWSYALLTLSDEGKLDRDRLLDACLDAFVRDFPVNQVSWYLEFHDAMAPRLDEMAARVGRYLALLAAPSTVAVALGQRACGLLLDAGPGRLDVPAFLAASPPAFGFPQKWVALNQLKLLGTVAARDESARPQALAVAAEAFSHPREDVQQAALKLIAKHGIPADPAAHAAITALAASLSAVLARDAVTLGLMAPPAATATVVERSPAHLAYRSPSKPEPVVPVTDPAELIQLFARLIENASDAVAVERAVAGAVRLASLPLADRARLAGPLMKRAEQVAGGFGWSGFTGGEIRADLSRLVHVWATGQRPTIRPKSTRWPDNHPYKHPDKVSDSRQALMMSAIITARVFEACELVASGRPVTLLAEPEFADGTIGHSALLDRLASSSLFGWHDVGVALLRLEPGAPDAFWAEWGRIHASMAPQAHRAYLASTAELDFETFVGGPVFPYVLASLATPVPAAQVPVPSTGNGSIDHCWRLLVTDLTNQTQTHLAHRERADSHWRSSGPSTPSWNARTRWSPPGRC
jgi:hypothetical protein